MMVRFILFVGAITFGATCSNDSGNTICDSINESNGHLTCRNEIRDDESFIELAALTSQGRVLKFISPARLNPPIATPAFIETSMYPLHSEFLKAAVPETYGSITNGDYARLFFLEDRDYFSGHVLQAREGVWTFSILEDALIPASFISKEQAIAVWNDLQPRFKAGVLLFAPSSARQAEISKTWTDTPFEIHKDDLRYEAYNDGQACGYLRFVSVSELESVLKQGGLNYRDIVVLDAPPADLEKVVSGIITETPQGPLSHLAVRSAARGTTNAYIEDARAVLSSMQDDLVCMDFSSLDYSIHIVGLETAESFWEQLRPAPLTLEVPDLVTTTIQTLRMLPTETDGQRREAVRAYGSKGTNLATLYQRIDTYNSYKGLLVPAAYYHRFMNETEWNVDLGAGIVTASFQESIDAWLSDSDLLSDGVKIRMRLAELRAAMENAVVPQDMVQMVYDRIELHFGDDRTMVRFRSSSNAEDALEFAGAGLYDSTSVCPADDFDAEVIGPSLCDDDKNNERTIARGLKNVWASTWNMKAFDERQWYGIDQHHVTMAILVNDRAKNERANVVAFSGNIRGETGDTRLLLAAQHGAYDLVSPSPGVRPEVLLLSRDNGSVSEVTRVSKSTVGAGTVVKDSDATLIGNQLIELESLFPLDNPEGQRVLLDTEWKVLDDGALVIKQIRPFLESR